MQSDLQFPLTRSLIIWISSILSSLYVLGCSAPLPTIEMRQQTATSTAATYHWHPFRIHTDNFDLIAYGPDQINSKTLHIYLEGDGHAWENRETPSMDPTPIDPISLRLALSDPIKSSAYLGRPCQYIQASKKECSNSYWTNARFSQAVIGSTNQAIDQIKARYGAKHLVLIGYSGGGAVALLSATQRTDVIKVVTIAGNLDTEAWTEYHGLSPLNRSLNPANYAEILRYIPQTHWVGSKDQIMPPEIASSYLQHFPQDPQRPIIRMMPFSHTCCWVQAWPQLAPKDLPNNLDNSAPHPY